MSHTPSASSRLRCRNVLAAFVISAVGWSLPATASATVGAPVDAGDVVVVAANDGSREVTDGGSATEFSLRLPADAACPGDSLHDQWRVQTFIVPATDDPGSLRYGVIAPDGDGRFVLYNVRGEPLIHVLTRANSGAGEPGAISEIPPLSFAVFKPGILQGGRYRIGVACTLFRETAKYWDTELVLTASPGDSPGQFVWRLANSPARTNDTNRGTSLWLISAIGALCAGALGGFVWQRTTRKSDHSRHIPPTRRKPTLSKEPK